MAKILIKSLVPRTFETFTEHTLISGKAGSGKSNAGEFIITQKVNKQKIIDL